MYKPGYDAQVHDLWEFLQNQGMTPSVFNLLVQRYPLCILQKHAANLEYSDGYRPGEKNAGLYRHNVENEIPVSDAYLKAICKKEHDERRGIALEAFIKARDADTPGYRALVESLKKRHRILDSLRDGGTVKNKMIQALAIEEIVSRGVIKDLVMNREEL